MADNNDKSPHILNTSATLPGICFAVLTSLDVMKATEKTSPGRINNRCDRYFHGKQFAFFFVDEE